MNRQVSWLFGGSMALLAAAIPLRAENPPTLDLDLYAGLRVTGTVGSVYTIQRTTDPAQADSWRSIVFLQLPATNYLFVDTSNPAAGNQFYRALLQNPFTNMVFLPATTFAMGSSTNESGHNPNESPQTRVTLSRGFLIGKFEVTQGEYLDVTGTNPSVFPGDLNRPVSSVSWPDATNYCWQLTQRELAARRIPVGSQYRLPTEAEWEYAARADSSTRFSYGEDLTNASLTNYAWYFANSALRIHPVGQKLPNAFGLYDMHGNVWEWCQDWLGDLPGGTVVDPQGPDSNSIGWKVIRGGGYDFSEGDCRSARRYFFGNHPALTDSNLGFRVVLACE
jgi:formylglycine-generating enzyme required for sulfatase activity